MKSESSSKGASSAQNPSTGPSRGTRDVILETALRIVGRDGLEGLTIGELAKVVGMSKSGLFAHFGGKDQLQLAVLELAVKRFVDIVMRPAFKASRGEPRISAVFDNWLAHLNDRSAVPGGSVLIAASTELDDRPGVLRDYVQGAQKQLIANIEKAAQMAVDEGHFRPDLDVGEFAWMMYAFVLGYYHSERMLEDPKAELHLKHAFEGLVKTARAKSDSRKPEPKKKKVRRSRAT